MLELWTGEIAGEMHINRITKKELAEHIGWTPEYVSMILNGRKKPTDAERKMRRAIAEIKELRAK